MSEQDWTDETTNQYSMRQAANELLRTFGRNTNYADEMPSSDQEVINFAYQQLLRAANMVAGIEKS